MLIIPAGAPPASANGLVRKSHALLVAAFALLVAIKVGPLFR